MAWLIKCLTYRKCMKINYILTLSNFHNWICVFYMMILPIVRANLHKKSMNSFQTLYFMLNFVPNNYNAFYLSSYICTLLHADLWYVDDIF